MFFVIYHERGIIEAINERYHDSDLNMKTCVYYNLRRGIFWGVLLAGFIGILCIVLLRNLGYMLHVETELPSTPVQTMIVLSGGGDRIEYAVDLFLEGSAKQMMITGGVFDGTISNASFMANYAISKGIGEESIILEHEASNTFENALFTKNLFQKSPQSIMLITSDYHQKRAFLTFQDVYPETIILNAPAPSSYWRADRWWESKKSVYLTLTENIKIWWGQLTGVWG
jgi:uncharacterized SAM-binding protein YcdF (DUF218 family)